MPQSMGFEETETIGPDGKAHIISEVSQNGASTTPKSQLKLPLCPNHVIAHSLHSKSSTLNPKRAEAIQSKRGTPHQGAEGQPEGDGEGDEEYGKGHTLNPQPSTLNP